MIRRVLAGLLATLCLGSEPEPLERVGRLAAPAIREASGMVASRRFPGIYWVHNDSRNAPELFAVRRDGSLVRSYKVAAANVDWEDIATDDAGHLYIADTGNNRHLLPLRVILKVEEPDPSQPETAANPLPVLAASHYRFPDGRRFDAEGLVVTEKRALLITKRLDGEPAEVYGLMLDPAPAWRPATPERLGTLAGCVEPVTGATLTPDGRTLAVVTDRSVRVYEASPRNDWLPIGATEFVAPDVEAITWDGADLLLASEDRSIYRVPARRWRPEPRPGR